MCRRSGKAGNCREFVSIRPGHSAKYSTSDSGPSTRLQSGVDFRAGGEGGCVILSGNRWSEGHNDGAIHCQHCAIGRYMIITREEMIAAWRDDELVRYDAAAVNALSIPEDGKQFLIEVGLPCWNGAAIAYGVPSNDLPSMATVKPHKYLPRSISRILLQRYRILGLSGSTVKRTQGQSYGIVSHYDCLDETDGSLATITGRDGVLDIRFLNSSVLHLAKFLLLDRQRQELFEQSKNKDMKTFCTIGRRIAKEMRKVDPVACEEGKAWAQKLFIIENGL
ncbi:MAG: immunity protein [Chthonomonadaceae bacterium]|nr:immunity protein [Chthonomonadaceae bacterium]